MDSSSPTPPLLHGDVMLSCQTHGAARGLHLVCELTVVPKGTHNSGVTLSNSTAVLQFYSCVPTSKYELSDPHHIGKM